MKRLFKLLFALAAFTNHIQAVSLNGTAGIVYISNGSYVFRNFNTATGFVRLGEGFTILAGQSATLDTFMTVSGGMDLRTTGSLGLLSDLYFGTNVTFSSGGTINAHGNTIHLGSKTTLQTSSVWQFISDATIDGHGNTLLLQPQVQLLLASNVSVTLKNMFLDTTRNSPNIPIIKCLDGTGYVTLDNVTLALADNFEFRNGHLFFNNDVRFTGTASFIYQSPQQSYIAPNSFLTFDPNTTLYYYPSSTNRDLIQMVDQSSVLYFKGPNTTLQTTTTGMRLTKGRLWMDNQVTLSTQAQTALDTVTQITGFNYGSVVNSVAWSPNRQFLAVSGVSGLVNIYQFANAQILLVASTNFGGTCLRVKWSPDGRYVAVAGGPNDNIKIYSFNSTTLTLSIITALSLGTGFNIQGLDWSHNGKFIAVGPNTPTSGNEIQIYSFNGFSLTLVTSVNLGAAGTFAPGIAWGPHDNFLAIGANSTITGGNEIHVYSFNGSTLTDLTSISYSTANSVQYVEFDQAGLNIAVGGQSPTSGNELQIYRFNGTSLQLIASANYGTIIQELHWDPSGHYLVIGGNSPDNGNELQFYQFNGTTLSLISNFNYGTGASINGLSWSADGAMLALGGQTSGAGNNEIEVYSIAYRFDTTRQGLSSGLSFGNSVLGSTYDLHAYLFSGSYIQLYGVLNYDPAI